MRSFFCLFLCWLLVAPLLSAQQRDQPAERALYAAANRERADRALPPLEWNNALARAAQQHTSAMAERRDLSHQLADEPALGPRLAAAGARLSAFAENVGLADAADAIHNAWMHSEGHRRNLLDPGYNVVGIAVYRQGNTLYATEDFGTQVGAVSAEDADLQVRDAIAQERSANHLPPLRILPLTGKPAAGCSAPPISRSAAIAPGSSRSIVTYTTTTPTALGAAMRSRVDDPRFNVYSTLGLRRTRERRIRDHAGERRIHAIVTITAELLPGRCVSPPANHCAHAPSKQHARGKERKTRCSMQDKTNFWTARHSASERWP